MYGLLSPTFSDGGSTASKIESLKVDHRDWWGRIPDVDPDGADPNASAPPRSPHFGSGIWPTWRGTRGSSPVIFLVWDVKRVARDMAGEVVSVLVWLGL